MTPKHPIMSKFNGHNMEKNQIEYGRHLPNDLLPLLAQLLLFLVYIVSISI